jgi:hypothetical protein
MRRLVAVAMGWSGLAEINWPGAQVVTELRRVEVALPALGLVQGVFAHVDEKHVFHGSLVG